MHDVDLRPRSHETATPEWADLGSSPQESVETGLRSPGVPLPTGVRDVAEAAFGLDLREVRLHADAAAAGSAADLGAHAYTVGDHVVLGRGIHEGLSTDGAIHRTLVHELAHVVQQRGGAGTAGPLQVSRADDASERAADSAAREVSSGRRVTGLIGTAARRVARQTASGVGQQVSAPQIGSVALDANEAAERVTLLLFDSHGFFQALRDVLDAFEHDMKTRLGWYAGSQIAPAPQSGLAGRIATGAAGDVAKQVGKAALGVLVQGLSGATIGAGPAGVAAGLLVGAITTAIGDLDTYRPVVLVEARKPAHQVLIESIRDAVGHAQDDLRDQWTAQITESVRQLGVAGLTEYARRIRQATDEVRASFYLALVSAYLRLGTGGQDVELETPHALYSGSGRGFKVFQGARYWVETIAADEVYVEFTATGFTEADFRITRTVVPRLPSTVLQELNASTDPTARLANLPFGRLVMEGKTPVGPAKLVWDGRDFTAPDTPHFAKLFLLNIAKAAGDNTNWVTGGDLSSGEHNGAVHLYAWIVTQPIGQLHFSA